MLVIEDGSMAAENPNSFATVEEADTYFSARNSAVWPASGDEPDANLAQKEAALIRATDYLNTLVWLGAKKVWDWPVCWPRIGVPMPGESDETDIPDNVIPLPVKRACIELAGLFYGGTDPLAAVEHGGRVQSETVGPISISYFDDASVETYYPAVGGLLASLLAVVPGMAKDTPSFSVHKVIPA